MFSFEAINHYYKLLPGRYNQISWIKKKKSCVTCLCQAIYHLSPYIIFHLLRNIDIYFLIHVLCSYTNKLKQLIFSLFYFPLPLCLWFHTLKTSIKLIQDLENRNIRTFSCFVYLYTMPGEVCSCTTLKYTPRDVFQSCPEDDPGRTESSEENGLQFTLVLKIQKVFSRE